MAVPRPVARPGHDHRLERADGPARPVVFSHRLLPRVPGIAMTVTRPGFGSVLCGRSVVRQTRQEQGWHRGGGWAPCVWKQAVGRGQLLARRRRLVSVPSVRLVSAGLSCRVCGRRDCWHLPGPRSWSRQESEVSRAAPRPEMADTMCDPKAAGQASFPQRRGGLCRNWSERVGWRAKVLGHQGPPPAPRAPGATLTGALRPVLPGLRA